LSIWDNRGGVSGRLAFVLVACALPCCLTDFTLPAGPVDSGATDSGIDTAEDTGTGEADDPSCGALEQDCCDDSECDEDDLSCVSYPSGLFPRCYIVCDPVPCVTLEGYADGICDRAGSGNAIGVCNGVERGHLPEHECTTIPCTSGNCFNYHETKWGCFAVGCEYRSTCELGTWCANLTSGGGACIPPDGES